MKAVILMSLLTLLIGCSGLSQSDCVESDWQQIGFEDGQDGKGPSQIDTYQESCAKYDLPVDIPAYLEGHAQGARLFCSPENGFETGTRGYDYTGICPPDLEGAFLREHDIGYEFYYIYRDISELESAVSRNEDTINKLHTAINRANFDLDNATLTQSQRMQLMQSIRSMEDQIRHYSLLSPEIESMLFQRQRDLRYLRDLHDR